MTIPGYLARIGNFGDVSAEQDDAVLSYFLKTEAVDQIASGDKSVVLGRKGSGKTALAKYFAEPKGLLVTSSLSLRDYPWALHGERRNTGASDIESYVSSWRYLIAVKATAIMLQQKGMKQQTDVQRAAHQFLIDNYGGLNPSLADILRPPRLRLSKTSFSPQVMGNALGGIEFESKRGGIPPELDALTDLILSNVLVMAQQVAAPLIFLHFDELDQGLETLDIQRKQMIVGLILAARAVRSFGTSTAKIVPVIYLRTDIWDELRFSDKNKISQSSAVNLEWNNKSLQDMIDERIKAKLGDSFSWKDIDDSSLMRGSQTKWNHIVLRTFLRPRDVIQFLNFAVQLGLRLMPDADIFENADIQAAREPYSRYLKQELDDEISPHWETWGEALQACSELATITFSRDDFRKAYDKRRSRRNPVDADEALNLLYKFSVIGYRRGIGAGGSGWVFQYTDPDAGWDNGATKLKVHLGLKEFAKLREERGVL